jgi:hypothetical protein
MEAVFVPIIQVPNTFVRKQEEFQINRASLMNRELKGRPSETRESIVELSAADFAWPLVRISAPRVQALVFTGFMEAVMETQSKK